MNLPAALLIFCLIVFAIALWRLDSGYTPIQRSIDAIDQLNVVFREGRRAADLATAALAGLAAVLDVINDEDHGVFDWDHEVAIRKVRR